MWKADMARRTCFREQYYTGTRKYFSARKIAGRDPRKLCIKKCRFFIDISGYLYSFGLARCVVQDIWSVHVPVAARWSRKSVGERFGGTKVACAIVILAYFHILWP